MLHQLMLHPELSCSFSNPVPNFVCLTSLPANKSLDYMDVWCNVCQQHVHPTKIGRDRS